jgi:hypothetical protein
LLVAVGFGRRSSSRPTAKKVEGASGCGGHLELGEKLTRRKRPWRQAFLWTFDAFKIRHSKFSSAPRNKAMLT